ncbi:Rossmann-like and DUF2520 domain-containing protein [Aquimarina sp. AU474]|uniref:Rossmann-like and DUF2520 domain-containing protein n=1 Tax=Aquimarina sp. AU474 TaxID=2108529 RepID=UPI000D68E788|nr:DUF2520 domain-containing protein [Aquimarina sp. AU474]
MIKVVILGGGNVAQHLYTALSSQKLVDIVQCYNRKGITLHPDQNNNKIVTDLNKIVLANIYILAVSDDAIEEISTNLPFQNRFVVHTSGSVPMSTIKDTNRKGVFYPLQTFSKNTTVDFTKIPFCIEAESKDDKQLLKKLASFLSPKVYEISSEQRNILHVSAVFVNNFTNYLFSVGNDICDEHEIPFEILHPLIQETAQKIQKIIPDKAQTGPAIRNDLETIQRHLNILTDNTQKEIYQTLTRSIQSKYGKKL